jgi:hypothetical protein
VASENATPLKYPCLKDFGYLEQIQHQDKVSGKHRACNSQKNARGHRQKLWV